MKRMSLSFPSFSMFKSFTRISESFLVGSMWRVRPAVMVCGAWFF
jgi:hypothetical protein